jgi:PAS domain S-box-containing protein
MEVTKFRSQLLIALEQMMARLRQTQLTLTVLGSSVARSRRLREALGAIASRLRKLVAISRDATVSTNAKFTRQASIGLQHLTVQLRRAHNAITRLGRRIADKPRRLGEALRASENGLRKLVAISRDATVSTNAKFTRQASIGLQHLTVQLRRAHNAITRLGRRVADKPRRLEEALRASENGLRNLLASSPDAIVVTNAQRRFVAANPKALDLFGVSEAHIGRFTVDVFLSRDQIPQFDGSGSSFRRGTPRHGKCEVRRLDGSLRVAEYSFVANFMPARHLYTFRNVAATNQYQPASLRNTGWPTRPCKQIGA